MPLKDFIFLGTSGAIQVPSFHCNCRICESARNNPEEKRTRTSVALIGEETTLIDANPDLEFQLERETIRTIDHVFITHWHFDHIGGLASLGEPSELAGWDKMNIYLPEQVMFHFDQELAYMKDRFYIHPVKPKDTIKLLDATFEVVKTTHTDHSIGFIITHSKRVAYLIDGIVPPRETLEQLTNIDYLILEATVDKLLLPEGKHWVNFSLEEAINFWKTTKIEKCILTHYSGHSWRYDKLVAGISHNERLQFEEKHPNLKFAFEGMKIKI